MLIEIALLVLIGGAAFLFVLLPIARPTPTPDHDSSLEENPLDKGDTP